jgi:oligosaccharide repeat unit polymerase
LWGALSSPLPGQQWDARAIVSKEVYGVRQTSLVSTIFGPWYLDFGFVGVLLGLAVLGYVLSRLEEGALTKKSHVHQAAYAYGLVLVGLSIHTGLSDFAFAVFIPAVILWAARSPGAPAAAPEGVASESGQGHS